MRGRSGVSSSGPFLIELLIGLLVFSLTAAICLQIFVGAHQISSESNALNIAVIKAQNGAESFKASGGDLEETAKLLGGDLIEEDNVNNVVWKHFDSGFTLEVRQVAIQHGYIKGEAVVRDMSGTSIFSLPIAVLEVAP